MAQQSRAVQLSAAASLALVFGRDEESSRAGGKAASSSSTSTTTTIMTSITTTSMASGQEIFADFRSQNLRSFWNKRLVRAVGEVRFQGWMENLVLFLQGDASSLEVIREAWMRRALRSPKGFVIKAVGDLSPIQMSPVSQSQFIPLAEVLCSAISDMNSSQTTVTQEALVNHMSKAHPGMTIPTQDILYNALGALIKERKIYHTGEGYFIVTPQTYFITNSLVREKNWWASPSGDDPPSPPPITYLLNNEACNMDSAHAPLVAHCKSCSCFAPPQASPNNATTPTVTATVPPSVVPDGHSVSISISECTGKSLKWPRPSEHKPTLVHQSTSTAADYQPSELSKTTATTNATSRKDKDGKDNKSGRKFGLSLFWRNGGKKEKPKKEYASFSGQFPPEEWPVRDEEDLNNLPRDLEHAIIKRINPELTVDNLTRHTVLMKKLEDRGERVIEKVQERVMIDKGERVDRGVDKGISTEILTVSKPRHHQSSRGAGAGRRSAPKASHSKRRPYSSREKHREKDKERVRNKTHICEEEYLEDEDLVPSRLQADTRVDEPEHIEEAGAGDEKCVYKKRIDNPFHAQPTNDTPTTLTANCKRAVANNKGHRRRDTKESRTSAGGRKERTGLRSKSWDPHRANVVLPEAQHAGKSCTPDDSYARLRERDLAADNLLQADMKLNRELPSGYSAAYPQSSTLRIDDKLRHQAGPTNMEARASEDEPRSTREPQSRGSTDIHRHQMEQTTTEVPANISPYSDAGVILPTHPYDSVSKTHDPVVPWTKANASLQRRHSLRHAEKREDNTQGPDLLHSHQQSGDITASRQQEVAEANVAVSVNRALFSRQELVADSGFLLTNSHDFIEDDHRLYQEEEEDEDACSSLYLNEEDTADGAPYVTTLTDHHGHHVVYSDYDSDMHYQRFPHRYQPHAQASVQEVWDSSITHADSFSAGTQGESSPSPNRVRQNSWSHPHHSQISRSPGLQSEAGPRRATLPTGEPRQGGSLSSEPLEPPQTADSSIFDYCQTSEVESDAETVRRSVGEGDGESAHWRAELEEQATEERLERVVENGTPQSHVVGLSMPSGAGADMGESGEIAENQSITGDSGIDSPRTRVSLATNNTVILEGLKKRGFLQNLEKLHSKSSTMRPQSSLLQLTPVMNV
ncbi:Storkhead-box protein 1 [Merluccius polli]|uniref:Storkhead-box protein 1 n=1 Tax=Merluccius polli TaxID=89951 RepID=A0AA47MG85_MERPO|nr:Storkhead-box protein 1 [Merluccius polli]